MQALLALSVLLYATTSADGTFWNIGKQSLSAKSAANIFQNILNTLIFNANGGEHLGTGTLPPTAVNPNLLSSAIIKEIIASNQDKRPTTMRPTTLSPDSVSNEIGDLIELNNFFNQINSTVSSQNATELLQVDMEKKNQTTNDFNNSFNNINENIGNFFAGVISQINTTVTNATQSIFANGPQINFGFRMGENSTRTTFEKTLMNRRTLILEEITSNKLRRRSQTNKTETVKFLSDTLVFLNNTINSVDMFTKTINSTIAQQENNIKYMEQTLVTQLATGLSDLCKPVAVLGIGDIRAVAQQNAFSCVYDEVKNYRHIRRLAMALITDINTALDIERMDVEIISNIFSALDIVMEEFETTQTRFQDCEKAAGITVAAKTVHVSTRIAACQAFGIVLYDI